MTENAKDRRPKLPVIVPHLALGTFAPAGEEREAEYLAHTLGVMGAVAPWAAGRLARSGQPAGTEMVLVPAVQQRVLRAFALQPL